MVRCPGCGGRNEATARACEWCGRSFVAEYRPRSLAWILPAGGVVIAMLAVLLVALAYASLRSQPSPRESGEPAATASRPPELIERPPLVDPTPVAIPTDAVPIPSLGSTTPPTGPPVTEFVRVGNTGGTGAFIRREPQSNAPGIIAHRDGAVLRVVGADSSVNGRLWRQVEDPRGNRGWTPAEYLLPSTTGF